MAVKACLFDLDGTLLNTLFDIGDAMNHALSDNGLPEHSYDAYRYFVGNGVKVLTERATGFKEDAYDRVLAAYRAYYAAGCRNKTGPYEGIQAMLAALSRMGLPLCVLSNKPHDDTLEVVSYYFHDIAFTKVQGQLDSVPVKPDPAGALVIAKALNISPSDFLYAGDTGVDMACARSAGMQAVGVTWGFRPEAELLEYGAQHIISHPDELPTLIQKG